MTDCINVMVWGLFPHFYIGPVGLSIKNILRMHDGRRTTDADVLQPKVIGHLNEIILVKVALCVCFALKSWKEYLLLFTYLSTLGKDVTFPLITKFKTNRPLSYVFVNRIPN